MEIPPQVLKQQVRQLAANQDLQSLKDEYALQAFGNRLPVLQAFHEFLELERRQARRRLRIAALSFLGMLLGLLLIGGAFFYRFAGRVNRDMRQLEQALAVARSESGALREDARTMQRALEEARQAVDSLRARFESSTLPGRVPARKLDELSAAFELIPQVQQVQAEYHALRARLDGLQAQFELLLADREQWSARIQRAGERQRELMEAVGYFSERRRETDARLAKLRDAASPNASNSAARRGGLFSGRKELPAPARPDSTAVVALLDELSELRFVRPALQARLDELEQECASIEAADRGLVQREMMLRREAASVLRALEQLDSTRRAVDAQVLALRDRRDEAATDMSAAP